jgi:hypothetical protein
MIEASYPTLSQLSIREFIKIGNTLSQRMQRVRQGRDGPAFVAKVLRPCGKESFYFSGGSVIGGFGSLFGRINSLFGRLGNLL